jgi:glutamate-1-semialdehyde aminotransferase
MRVILEFDLPDDQGDYDAARLGRQALAVLREIDQRCREVVKYGEPTPEQRQLAEEIRRAIPGELLDV